MSIQEIINKLYPYRKIILTGVGLLILLFAVIFIFNQCTDYMHRREIEQDKKAVNELLRNANDLEGNLQKLEINEALREAETNRARNDYNGAKNETDKARQLTDNALREAERLRNANYNGINASQANNARCRAYPESCQ